MSYERGDAVDEFAVASAIERAAVDYADEPRRLSPVPFILRSGELSVWAPPAAHPAAPLVARAHRLLADVEYDAQAQRLDQTIADAGVLLAVPSYTLMTSPDGVTWAWAMWPGEGAALLPEADRLMVPDGSDVLSVAFDDAVAAGGRELRLEPGVYPVRWRVDGPPSPALLERLRSVGKLLGG